MKRYLVILVVLSAIHIFLSPISLGKSRIVVQQEMDLVKVFAMKNTRFIIKENIDLKGKTVKIGKGCVLLFRGGSLTSGTIVGDNTQVESSNYEIFKRGYTRFRAYKQEGVSDVSPPSIMKVHYGSIVLEGTWSNRKCGTRWTGLLKASNEDVMLAVKNYIVLHANGAKVTFPTFSANGYESIKLPGNHILDFNHSKISYPDNLRLWEDKSIKLPNGTIPCGLESGYGLISLNNNTIVKNLAIDGKSGKRQNEIVRLGVSCIVSIGNANNVTFENISLSNVLGPGMTAQSKSKNITFKDCRFYNIGEHVLYSHQYLGYCRFENCTFELWDSERIANHRNGLDYVYKHTPPLDKGISYDELYSFDLSFTHCVFNNPKRVSSQGRIIGGFFTGNFPVVVNINSCSFIGVQPPFNPGGGATISEKSGHYYMMIVRGCNGAPYVYPSKSNYNIVTEFYDCINIPFRTVYARRYENCKLYLDLHEENMENVSQSFESEFAQPLVIKNCEFIDGGRDVIINHPLFHRHVVFESCSFKSVSKRKRHSDVVTVKVERLPKAVFRKCNVDLTGFRLVGGKQEVTIQHTGSNL